MDLHNFYNTSSYLPILNGSIAADLVILFIVYYTPYFDSFFLKNWYETYRLSAVIADVLILVIGFIITRAIFTYYGWSWNFYLFLGTILVVQILHDILFYLFFMNVPKGVNNMLDLFKKYAKESGGRAILGDSFMIIITVLLAYLFANYSTNINIISLVVLVYLIPYIIYTK
tara:strand:- start:732 stop:1247 length:516 start_codon:yes stop_codon:yes gene_type:complete